MNIQICKSKIHKAKLTACDLYYDGSIEIDSELIKKVGILPYEKVLIVNADNGERLETYVIPGEPGSKVFCLNGAAAHRGSEGDTVTIMAFGSLSEKEAAEIKPKIIVLDQENNIMMKKGALKNS